MIYSRLKKQINSLPTGSFTKQASFCRQDATHCYYTKFKQMKTNQMKLKSVPEMICMTLIMALLVLPAVSCSKNGSLPASPIELQNTANKLEGEMLIGSLSTESDEDGLALWCNGGKTLIGLAKIPSQGITDPGNIEHAQVVYSNFGIIICDTDTNKLWYYIQNDEKSQKRFQSLHSAGEKPIVSSIGGTIKLNLSHSS
jgi:hypothetical protein